MDGKRILLGTVVFERNPNSAIPAPGDFTLSEGRDEPFADFVTTQGQILDDTVVFHTPTVDFQGQLYLEGAIRILQLLTGQQTDVPVRPAEFDTNEDGKVGPEEAIYLMRMISQ